MNDDCQKLWDCADARLERLYEYLDGALSWDDLSAVQDHLASCQECSAQYDLECIIRSVVKRSCTEAAPQDLKSRIMIRIDEVRIEVTNHSSQH